MGLQEGRRPPTRLHVELYPRFAAHELTRAERLDGGVNLVIWKLSDRRLGHAFFDRNADAMTINSVTFKSPYLDRRGRITTVTYSIRQAGAAGERISFACPECEAARDVIYLTKAGWGCRCCSGLVHRSQRVSSLDLKWAKITALEEELRWDGRTHRRKGMHNSTFHRLTAELTALHESVAHLKRPPADRALQVSDELELSVECQYVRARQYLHLHPSPDADTGPVPWTVDEDDGFDD